jgi:flagellar biosynthesis/type III secretory pathway M-ring protein FliF/YscJ
MKNIFSWLKKHWLWVLIFVLILIGIFAFMHHSTKREEAKKDEDYHAIKHTMGARTPSGPKMPHEHNNPPNPGTMQASKVSLAAA